jgi:Ca2+-binding EF-hand superfamily protein
MKRSLILLTGLLAASAAFAQSTVAPAARGEDGNRYRERAEAKFGEADSNHDGAISQSEWQSASLRRAKEHFEKMDGNRDGKLSAEEMSSGRKMRGGGGEHGARREKLRAMDTDGDSQLSRSEIGTSMPRLAADFERLDGNRDGKLSREEIRAGRERHDGAQR